MQWFRLYSEFATDPKVQCLSEELQRRLIMLFCLQCEGSYPRLSHDEIACALRVSNETLHETFHVFQQKGFLDENLQLTNWNKRQYRSDKSTDRVRKHRAKTKTSQDETFQKRSSNADVTPPDTDTDTEDKRKNIKKEKIGFDPDTNQLTGISKEQFRAWKEAYPGVDVHHELLAMEQWLVANPAKRKQHYARFIVNWLSRAYKAQGGRKVTRGPGGELFV